MITPTQAERLARALADEIGATAEPGTAGLLLELVRHPGAQGHRSILLGHETGWLELVWRALEVAELADEELTDEVTEAGASGSKGDA